MKNTHAGAFMMAALLWASPLSAQTEPSALERTQGFHAKAKLATLLGGGELTGWWLKNVARSLPTANLPNQQPKPLRHGKQLKAAKISATTHLDEMTLAQALTHEKGGARGMIVVHRGKIVFESYPNMSQFDSHLWASVAKPTAALLVEILIDQGRVKDTDLMTQHVPDFKGTHWDKVRVVDLLDMTAGLDLLENPVTRQNPNSIPIRTFLAEFGEPNMAGKTETVRDVLRAAQPLGQPGDKFDYSSSVTQALVLLAEEVTQTPWPDLMHDYVWSHTYAEAPLQVHLAPDGMAAAHGIMSSRLRDLARFGLLYTDDWKVAAKKRVVSKAAVRRIQAAPRGYDFFIKGYSGPVMERWLGASPKSNSRQWDAVFEDGAMFKGGLFGQGLYVSPANDLVIAFFSKVVQTPLGPFLRPMDAYLAR